LGNYNITYANGTLTVTPALLGVTANSVTNAYGATNPVFTVSYTGFVNADSLTNSDVVGAPVLTTSATTNSPVGTYVITNTLGTLASTNYTFALTNGTLTIVQAAVTVTADAQTKAYGATDPTLTYTFSPALLNGDTFSGALSRVAGENVGSYAIQQGTLALSTNYSLIYVGTNLTITPASLTVTANSTNKVYGSTLGFAGTEFTASGLQNSETIGTVTLIASGGTGTTDPIGSYSLTPSAATGGTFNVTNYNVTYDTGTLTVTALAVTATADAQTKVYGATDPTLTYTFSPALVGSDSFSGSLSRVSGETVGSYAIQQGSLALSTNYSLSYVGANLTITAASPSFSISSSLNPAGYLAGVSFGATLTTNATGSVTFSSPVGAISTNTLTAGAASSLSATNLPRGTNLITVVYSGDSNYLPATNTLEQVITNHPPVAMNVAMTCTSGLPLEISLTSLATNWSDGDGDTVKLTVINFTTTNGISLFPINLHTNLDGSYVLTSAYLGYTSSATGVDQVSYTVSDGFGGTATGYINLTIVSSVTGTNSIASITVGNPNTLTAYGVPGFSYVTQRSTNLSVNVWTDIATNTAATNGLINVSDAFSDLGGNPPTSAFYRLLWHP